MFIKYSKLLDKDQNGFAAFAVTLIMMIVLSLIVLGFASNARNEQRRALDNALSVAAYYAAESGVNDASAIIKADLANGGTFANLPTQSQCTGQGYGTVAPTNTSVLQNNVGVAYTCLLVYPTPTSLEYAPIVTGHGQVVPVFGQNADHLTTITISWQQDSLTAGSVFTGCPTSTTNNFPPEAAWSANCSAGVLQIDIAPASGWVSESQLQADTDAVFLEPLQNSSNAVVQTSAVVNGEIIGVRCGANSGKAYDCAATLTLPNVDTGGSYLHIVPIYKNADVSVTAIAPVYSSSSPVPLQDAQALVDSTGKASDVLKRIEERISINPVGNNDLPADALQAESGICKAFTARPGVISGCPGT